MTNIVNVIHSNMQFVFCSMVDVSQATKLELGIDAPSVATGTGTALLLDGQDAALVRAAVVDAEGRVMHLAVC